MQYSWSSRMIEIRKVEAKGRSVFALNRFANGEVIERLPVIVLPGRQWKLLNGTALKDYYFH